MIYIVRAYKTEINPTSEQINHIDKTLGVCRHVKNLFIETNRNRYKDNQKYISHFEFSKWINLEYSKDNTWIKEVSSKAVKQALSETHNAYQRFFKRLSDYPTFKKKSSCESYYVIGNQKTIRAKRHKIFIPKLKWVKLKEFGYIPVDTIIKSARVIKENGRYFVSVLTDEPDVKYTSNQKSSPIGIDLGLSTTMYLSNGMKVADSRKNKRLIHLNKLLKRQQRKLSRKVKRSNNWYKQIKRLNRIYRRIKNIKRDLKHKMIKAIVSTHPQYITIEDLNIKGMMKNKRLSSAFQQIGLGYIIQWLKYKCNQYDIELRRVSRFYPSSQLCSQCQCQQKMPLYKRMYNCKQCGMKLDRDLNASINLVNATEYTVLVY